MAKRKNKTKQTPVVNLDGKDYKVDDLSENQKMIITHIQDLSRKIESTQFNLQQLNVGKDAFVGLLKQELDKDEDTDK
jgi:hypothetical protein|tara:strand:+ start:292 stop:525 length:234 start_codon:yes stop_codon:yes gene_type:complete